MQIRHVLSSLFLVLSICHLGRAQQVELVTPLADAPRYQLSNLRAEKDRFGRSVLAFDFRRTRAGEGRVSVSGKSGKGRLSITASVSKSQESGTIRLGSIFSIGGDTTTDIEIYLVQPHRISAKKTLFGLISNTVRMGNPGSASTARAWTSDEKSMHAEFSRIMNDDSAHKPVKVYPVTVKPPEGHEFVPNTAKLTNGTKLQACFQDKWYPLTTLSENDDGSINVRWDTFGAQYDCSMKRGELVIATSMLGSLEKHPATRFPTTVPNWASADAKNIAPPSPNAKRRKRYPVTIAVPADSELVPADLTLKPGIPLQACYASKWNPITTLGENDDGTLDVRWDEYGSAFDCSMVRSELIIKKQLAQQLRANPASVKVAAPVVEPKRRKSYPVSIPVPSDSVFVPSDAELQAGTKLQACYARKWNPITFLSANNDGTLNVRWDDYGPAFDCSMVRNELIIKKSVLQQSQPAPTAAEMHTFTDATGQFKVTAKVLEQTATEVTLLTDKGKKVTVPLSKLSEPDQEFLRKRATAKNPFE